MRSFTFDLQLFASAPESQLTSLMVGKETTFSTAATPTATHIPDSVMFTGTNETLSRPGATKSVGQNDEPVGMYVGKFDLSVEPDPDNLGTWLLLALGAESILADANNPTVPTGTPTLTAGIAAGVSILPFSSATGYIAGNGFRIDAGLPTQEDLEIASVASLNVTVTVPTRYAHATAAAIAPCVLAQDHTFTLASPRLSFTAQHYRVLDTVNFVGCKVQKLSLSMSPKQVLSCKVSGVYADEAPTLSPTSPSYSTINPYTFQQQLNAITINGVAASASVTAFTVDIDTGVVSDYPRYGNGRFPFVFAENRTVVSLKTSLMFEDLVQRNNFYGLSATGPQNTVPSIPLSILMNSPDYINAGAAGAGLFYSLLLTFGLAKPISAPISAKANSPLSQEIQWKIFSSARGQNNDVTAKLVNASSSASL